MAPGGGEAPDRGVCCRQIWPSLRACDGGGPRDVGTASVATQTQRSLVVAAISETCSVCAGEFDVQFRYQMEERDGGFSFYCSQRCLERSQLSGADQGGASATC